MVIRVAMPPTARDSVADGSDLLDTVHDESHVIYDPARILTRPERMMAQ